MSSTTMNGQQNAVDGLPKQFVTSLRVLFDILDEDRTGYVRLRDIETRWHEEGVKGLPSGVIDALRKVAPRNGRLSFDNFVTGLKLSLLKNKVPPSSSYQIGKPNIPLSATKKVPDSRSKPVKKPEHNGNYANMANYMNIERVPSTNDHKGNFPVQRSQPKMGSQVVTGANTATVRPNNVLQSQNIELRNQIYTRDQIQQASVKQHSKPDYQNQMDLDRNLNSRYSDQIPRASDDMIQYRKSDQSRTSQNPRPKSAHVDSHRQRPDPVYISRATELPPGRPERPPPYKKAVERDERPPALPPKNMQGRIMKELKNWQKEHKMGQHVPLHSTHSDSKLESNRLATNDLYGKLHL